MSADLRNLTAKRALALAESLSPFTRDEISERSGYGMSMLNRFFNANDDYMPGLQKVPTLCRAIGNIVVLDWQHAQLEELANPLDIRNCTVLLREVARLGREFGDVASATDDALCDGVLDAEEARNLCGELADVEQAARRMRDGLQHLAKQPGRYAHIK